MCVCLSVTTKAATYLVNSSKVRWHRVLYGVYMVWLCGFSKNVSFKSFGVICWPLLPSLLPDDLLMDKKKKAVMASFQHEECAHLAIIYIMRLPLSYLLSIKVCKQSAVKASNKFIHVASKVHVLLE